MRKMKRFRLKANAIFYAEDVGNACYVLSDYFKALVEVGVEAEEMLHSGTVDITPLKETVLLKKGAGGGK